VIVSEHGAQKNVCVMFFAMFMDFFIFIRAQCKNILYATHELFVSITYPMYNRDVNIHSRSTHE